MPKSHVAPPTFRWVSRLEVTVLAMAFAPPSRQMSATPAPRNNTISMIFALNVLSPIEETSQSSVCATPWLVVKITPPDQIPKNSERIGFRVTIARTIARSGGTREMAPNVSAPVMRLPPSDPGRTTETSGPRRTIATLAARVPGRRHEFLSASSGRYDGSESSSGEPWYSDPHYARVHNYRAPT